MGARDSARSPRTKKKKKIESNKKNLHATQALFVPLCVSFLDWFDGFALLKTKERRHCQRRRSGRQNARARHSLRRVGFVFVLFSTKKKVTNLLEEKYA